MRKCEVSINGEEAHNFVTVCYWDASLGAQLLVPGDGSNYWRVEVLALCQL